MHAIYPRTLIALSLTLTACGGGGDTSTNPAPNRPNVSSSNEFSGNLSIKINDQTAKNIQPRNTPDDSDYPAYQLVNTLGSDNVPLPSIFDYVSLGHTQSLNFWLDDRGETQLSVRVDPESQQIEQLELTQLQQDGKTLKQQFFDCLADSSDETRCQNASLSIASQTGRVAINFNGTQLLEQGAFETGRGIATLNGTLIGELSHAPQNLASIPKTSSTVMTIDGQPAEVVATSYTLRGTINLIEIRFKDHQAVLVSPKDNQVTSSGLLDAGTSSGTRYTDEKIQDKRQISVQARNNQTTLNFNQAQYRSILDSQSAVKTLNGQVTLAKPTQTLSATPWYKVDAQVETIVPNRFNVSVINHQDIILTANGFSAHIHGGKVQSVEFYYFGLDLSDPSSSITRFTEVKYECKKTACQGVQVEPNGFGVKFNNTSLTRVSSGGVAPTITLNGGLIYLGR